jgi:hypothetical protein
VNGLELDAEVALLELLAEPGGENRLGSGTHYLWERLIQRDDKFKWLTRPQRYEILWSLIHKGLIFLDIGAGGAADNWEIILTERGRAAASGMPFDPDASTPYISKLREPIPADDGVVLSYAEEAHRSYEARCYFAAVVMIGVASEVALLGLFASFGSYLDQLGSNSFAEQLKRKRMFAEKFETFRKFWNSTSLPEDIKANSDVWINAAAEVIRKHRNDAGHALVVNVDRSTTHMLLSIFPEYIAEVYDVKPWLIQNTPAGPSKGEGD